MMKSTATCLTWRGMGFVRLYIALSHHERNQQPYCIGLVTNWVNKDHAFPITSGQRF